MNIKLVKLEEKYKDKLFDMMGEWLSKETKFSPAAIRKNDYRDFENYLNNLEIKTEINGKVPDSVFFCLDTDRDIFVGAVNIRHFLNDGLCHTGGHIGDGIRPSERRKGYATAMIGLALDECRKLGINKVLMTCDTDNIGSAKSIINNGGVFESEIIEDGVPEQRYWITLFEEKVESERLLMTRMMPSDSDAAFDWYSDERLGKYMISSPYRTKQELFEKFEHNDPNSKEKYIMLIKRKSDGKPIGTSGFFFDKERGVWRFAYTVRYEEQNKGYATEATEAMIKYLSKNYGAQSFEAECAAENLASKRVMLKLGMKKSGESHFTKRDGTADYSSEIYSLIIKQKA